MSARIELDLDIFPGAAPTECVLALTWIAGCEADEAKYKKILRPWLDREAPTFTFDLYRNGDVTKTELGFPPIEDGLSDISRDVSALEDILEAAYRHPAPPGFVRSLKFRKEAETIDGDNYLYWPEVMAELARLPGLWPQQAKLVWLFRVSDHQAGDRYLLVPKLDGVGFTSSTHTNINEAMKEALNQSQDRLKRQDESGGT